MGKWLLGMAIAMLLLTSAGQPVAAADCPEMPTLTVQGQGTVEVAADRLIIELGVVSEGADALAAVARNNAVMAKVVAALGKVGLSGQEYQTSRYTIRPLWSSPPRSGAGERRPQIEAYSVTNRLTVKTTRIELAGTILAAATEAGANTIEGIRFDLADPGRHRAAAIRAATAQAMAEAEVLAAAAGVRLGPVQALSLDHADVGAIAIPMPVRQASAAMAAAPPVAAGSITVRASVTLRYAIGGDD